MTYALEVLTLIAGAAIMLALLPRVRRRTRHQGSARAPVRPADLQRLEVLVASSGMSAGDTHTTLRPLLRQIAAIGLNRRGVRLVRNADQARELLGEELWEIVRPGRPRPSDTRAPGVTLDQLARMTDRLERL
jgi:hypothetical protein